MKILVLLADGFEEIEALTVVDILRRAKLDVVTASISEKTVYGSHGIGVISDHFLNEVDADEFGCVFLPGGQPGTNHLKADERVLDLVKSFYESGKIVSAICAAPIVLSAAGILSGKRVTSFPGVREMLGETDYSEDRVVIDGNIFTGRSAGTAAELAFALVTHFLDLRHADAIKNAMFYQ